RRNRRGFTLIEAAIVTVLVGVGVVSIIELLAVGSNANRISQNTVSAVNLASSIHELSLALAYTDPQSPGHWGVENGEALATYDDIDDLDGQSFSPPIDARRQTISNLTNWTQA